MPISPDIRQVTQQSRIQLRIRSMIRGRSQKLQIRLPELFKGRIFEAMPHSITKSIL